MYSFVTAVGLAAGASAAILPRQNDGCCFQLTASGGQSGTVGQLDDGQNRLGGNLGSATYCINGGSITDDSGNGCILTSPTTQFQCDKGASPDNGFSVDSNGNLKHNGDSTFYACPADQDEYNLYTQKLDNQPKCVEVSLNTGGKCSGGAASQSSPTGGYSQTSPAGGQNTCPPQQTVTKTEQGQPQTVTKTEQITDTNQNTQYKTTTVYKTETEQNTQVKPTTVYSTKTEEETQTVTKPVTQYDTTTVQNTVTAETPTTVYKTSTVQNTVTAQTPTTVYKTSTVEETQTVPTTQYETKTQQVTVTAQTPTTVYKTSTVEETQTVPTTQYETKTQQTTVTAQTPTTVYKTSTVEETQTVSTTAYSTRTVEETETQKVPVTKTEYKTSTVQGSPVTSTEYKTTTEQGKPVTKYVTKVQTQTEENCSQTQGGGKPTNGGNQPTPTNNGGSACPTDLSGPYQSPHLIVPVSSEQPDQSYGTSYNGMLNESTSSVFSFDIPQSYKGQTCSLVFLFPTKDNLETSDYTFNGQGSVSVDHLSSAAGEDTTWNSCPKPDNHAGSFSPQPGNSYVVSTGQCQAGTTQSYEMSANGGLDLNYFQDYNPSPIGLYITSC